MPGRRLRSYRSGDLAEHLGLLLLKGIAAVAEVTRPEDFGLDAIATLLRNDADGCCYAENSFVVQLKSESKPTTIEYKDFQLDWLVGQSQPMFIGLVSRAESQISLYPTLFVNHAVLALHARTVTVRFGASAIPPLFAGQDWARWKGEPDHGATVWLGEPLLRWTINDLADNDWNKRTYETLKRFLGVARRELELLSFGQCSMLNWSTNDASSIASQPGIMKGGLDDLQSLADRCAPGLHALMLRAFALNNEAGNSLANSLVSLATALRDSGAEIDANNLFENVFFAMQSHLDDSDATAAK